MAPTPPRASGRAIRATPDEDDIDLRVNHFEPALESLGTEDDHPFDVQSGIVDPP